MAAGLKYNHHKEKCSFAKDFEAKYVDATKITDNLPDVSSINSKIKTTKVCCCSPELPHDETQKLKIIERTYDREICP